jgi:hypothetical protein
LFEEDEMEQKSIDLGSLFQSVTGTLAKNKKQLNDADEENHNHGDNMVDTFEVITQAMKEKADADPADQLAYASQLLRQRKSGSAQVYANGLEEASREFQGKQINQGNAMNLIQALMGGGQAVQQQPQQQSGGGLGSLLGSLLGGGQQQQQETQQQDQGLDMGDLLQAGMAFMGTKARGGSNLEAIVNAVVSNSAMANNSHRSQSGSLVANTLLQTIAGMVGR